jgi:glycosyltransferase involved in cell wall biosynthesis
MFSRNDHIFIICAYKENKYLEKCIKSVIDQTIKSNVILSTSTPNDYINDLADKYHLNIKINKGIGDQADNFNFAYSQAKTQLVTICHQDDFYHETYLEKLLKFLNKSTRPLIFFTNYFEVRNGKVFNNNKLLKIKRLMLAPLKYKVFNKSRFVRRMILSFGNPICCPSVCFVKQNVPSPIFSSEYKGTLDYHAWEELSKLKGEFVYSNKPLVFHRIHEDTGTTESIENNLRSREELEILYNFWPKPIAKILVKFYKNAQNSNTLK